MYMKYLWKDNNGVKPKYSEKIFFRCYVVYHKSYMSYQGSPW